MMRQARQQSITKKEFKQKSPVQKRSQASDTLEPAKKPYRELAQDYENAIFELNAAEERIVHLEKDLKSACKDVVSKDKVIAAEQKKNKRLETALAAERKKNAKNWDQVRNLREKLQDGCARKSPECHGTQNEFE